MPVSREDCQSAYRFRLAFGQYNRCSDCQHMEWYLTLSAQHPRCMAASGEGTRRVPGTCLLLDIEVANIYTSRCPAWNSGSKWPVEAEEVDDE